MSAFHPTRWSLLGAACEGDEDSRNELAEVYRAPLVRWLRSAGAGQDAEDLAQEVFLRLFNEVLGSVDPSAGKFRSLLLAVAHNVLRAHRTKANAKKRGGGKAPLSLDESLVPQAEREAFDREWVLSLVEQAVGELGRKHPTYHQAMVLHLGGASHEEIADQLGCSNKDVRNRLHRARKALGSLIRAAAWNTSSSPQDHATELELIRGFLPRNERG